MRRHCFAVLLLLAVISTGAAQYLETTVRFDTLGGVKEPSCLVYDSLDNRLFVGGDSGGMVFAIDCATNEVLASIPAGPDNRALAFNPVTGAYTPFRTHKTR